MHRLTPRPAARRAACAAIAVPVLLVVAGCSSDSDGGEDKTTGPSSSSSASAQPAPVKYKKLPDPCKTLPKGTVEDAVPGAKDKTGKNLASTDTERYGSCLWSGGSGKNDADYRSLTVSLKRYESDAALGSGDKQAERYFEQEAESVRKDEDNKGAKQSEVGGVGGKAVSLAYETEKKKQEYRVNRVVVLDHNIVITVDYEGTGFEGSDPPSAGEVRKNAEKAAKAAVKALG